VEQITLDPLQVGKTRIGRGRRSGVRQSLTDNMEMMADGAAEGGSWIPAGSAEPG